MLFKALSITGLAIIVSTIVLLAITLEKNPRIGSIHQLNATSAQQGKQLLKRLYNFSRQDSEFRIVSANQSEIDGVIALGQRAFPRVTGSSTLNEQGLTLAGSIKLPFPLFFQYLNVSTIILPSSDGLLLGDVSIGSLTLSGPSVIRLFSWTLDIFVKKDLAANIMNMVKAVKIDHKRITLFAEIDPSLINVKSDSSLFATIRDQLALLGDVETVKHYYLGLYELSKSNTAFEIQQGTEKYTLADFVNHAFLLAKKRSENATAETVKVESKAALVGLVLYFGPEKLKLLLSGLPETSREDEIKRYYLKNKVTLQGRVDLQKHFVYSIGLQLLSTTYASDAVGEFKEFLDANKGGSGFSFADLMADRAGTRLAIIVAKDDLTAESQHILATVKDSELLPTISGLKEGLNEKVFNQQYIDIQSSAYKRAIDDIDMRLKALPLYQLGW